MEPQCGAIVRPLVDGEARQCPAPPRRPLRVFEQVFQEKRIDLVAVPARQRRKPRQEHGVERRLDDKVQRDERLVPIAGDENPLDGASRALPVPVLFPSLAVLLAECAFGVGESELQRPLGQPLHPPQLVAGLERRRIADVAGRGDLGEIRRAHLQAVHREALRREHRLEPVEPFGRVVDVGPAPVRVLVEHAIHERLGLVLDPVVLAIGHFVRVAKPVPVGHRDRGLVAMPAQVPVAERVRPHLQRQRTRGGVIHGVGDDLVLGRSSPELAQRRPGAETAPGRILRRLAHGLPPFFVQVPDELVLTRAQPAAEGGHLHLERRQVERAPQVPLDGSSSHAALPFGADADVVAAIDDPDVLPGVIVLDGGEHRVGQFAGPEHRTDVIIEPGHLPLLRDA